MSLVRLKRLVVLSVFGIGMGNLQMAMAQNSSASTTQIADELSPESGERIYVHTDKSSYLAGEIVWFKLYYIEAGSYRPLDLSRVAYVELLDRQSKAIVQAKIEIDKRGGAGSLYLPASIASDRYVLRAYTRWMQNAGSSQYFETALTVINTVSAMAPAGAAATAPKMHFYPEGGQWLAGIRSVLGFRLLDANGSGLEASGVITDAAGDTVASFQPLKFGIGRIELQADAAQTYTARWQYDGKDFSQQLPRASDRGYGMQVTEGSNGQLGVEVFRRGLDQATEALNLVVHSNRQVKIAQQLVVANNQSAPFAIDQSKLAPGVNQITLFRATGQPVCERLLFVKPTDSQILAATSNQEEYGTRSLVNLDLKEMGNSTSADSVNLSVSVYQLSPWDDPFAAGMASHRWLLPELQGEVQSPEYYFSNDPDAAAAADNLMLTHGWRSFDAKKTTSKGSLLLPELKGHIITGRVIRKSDESPVPGELCYLSAPGYPFDLETARSNRQGWVYFEIDHYYGPGEIVVKAASDSATYFRVDISKPFTAEALRGNYASLRLQSNWATDLQNRSIAMQALNIYRADSLRRFSAPVPADTLPFFGKAEYTYKLDDYKRFTTMEEVLREFVAPIAVANRGGTQHLSILDELYKRSYDENVMVLIDGIPLTNHNKIFAYDPLKVKKLDIVTRRYVLGSANVGGVASFETFNGRFDAFELDPSVILIDYEGLQLQRSFYAPDYSQINDPRIPDFRSTLYWAPSVLAAGGADMKIDFYTSDQKGSFKVVVQGLTDSGKIITAERIIKVK